jgi:Outer membrane protein beta-barrel domain
MEAGVRKSFATLVLGLTGIMSTVAMAANGYGYGSDSSGDYLGNGFYVGASAGEVFYKESGLGTMVPTVAFAQIGEQFNPYVAIEGRVGGGVSGDDWAYFHVDMPLMYGGYVKGILPVTPWFSGYAIAGVTGLQIHRNYPDFNSSNAGFTFGAGAEMTIFGGAIVHAEFAQIDQGNNDGYHFTADQLAVGVSWRL